MNSATERPGAAGRFPDGIASRHFGGRKLSRHLANIVAFFILAGIMITALSGVLGGKTNKKVSVDAAAVRLEASLPETLRNGEMFDTEIVLAAKRDIASPTIAISSSYWHNVTINSVFPEPSEQAFRNGAFRFEFDEMKRNDVLRMKIAGQVNPTLLGGNSGTIAILDGERVLAAMPVKLEVLP